MSDASFRLQSVEAVAEAARVDQRMQIVAPRTSYYCASGQYDLAGAVSALVTVRLTAGEAALLAEINQRVSMRLAHAAAEGLA